MVKWLAVPDRRLQGVGGVALRAIQREQSGMHGGFGVATGALGAGVGITAGMAVGALRCGVLSGEGKARDGVIEIGQRKFKRRKIASAVVGVAGAAGIRVFQSPVQPVAGRHLLGHVLVALAAQFGLAGSKGAVAQTALALKAGVSGIFRDCPGGSRRGGERAGVEDQPALPQVDANQQRSGCQRNQQADGGEQRQLFSFA